MTQLLVSVRSSAEAEIALASGADVIDVKEPRRGPLGRADDEVVLAVQRAVAGHVPISMALGELKDAPTPAPPGFAGFVKLGLYDCPDWPGLWSAWRRGLDPAHRPVLVAYADQPEFYDVVNYGFAQDVSHLLIDTFQKDGATLLNHLQLDELAGIVGAWHGERRQIALAGSLTRNAIELLLPLEPDLIAVRGAACQGQRASAINAGAVQALAMLVHGSALKFTTRTVGN